MKKHLLLLLVAIIATSTAMAQSTFSAVAPSGQMLYYKIVNGEAHVVRRPGSIQWNVAGNLIIPDSVVYNGSTYAVTALAFDSNTYYGAFYNCSLKSVTIPPTVTSIDLGAFYSCRNLTSVSMPNSLINIGINAFYGCSKLRTLTIPDSVSSIGNNAFNGIRHIEYHGIATGAPWGAYSMNGIIDGDFIFSDTSRTCILSYLGNDTSVVIPNSVTNIGNAAFLGCDSLTSITIPPTVTSISNGAFSSCSNLFSVIIPNSITNIGNNTFAYCYNLTSVTLPDSLISIGSYAFVSCSSLVSITLPESLTSIGFSAFGGCSSLLSITIPDLVTSIGVRTFSGCSNLTQATIGNSVTDIGEYAFYNCSNLTSVTIPNSVTSIGNYAFHGCSNLTSLALGNSVNIIETHAFSHCPNLTSVTIPNSVTEIGYCAFQSCHGLTSVVFNADSCVSTVTDYYNAPFNSCNNISSFTIGNTVSIIPSFLCTNLTNLTSITIPNSVTSIGQSSFYGCTGLTSIAIPATVASIGNNAFSCNYLTSIVVDSTNTLYDSRDNCNAIIQTDSNILIQGCKNTVIPASVINIGPSSFYGCYGLTSITIPSLVTNIGDDAFSSCYSLDSVILMPNTPPTISNYCFISTAPNFYVPCGTIQDYQNVWGSYWSFMEMGADVTFILTVNDSTLGSVEIFQHNGADVSCVDSSVIILATANEHYHFDHWNNGNTVNPDTLYLDGDSTVTAFFAIDHHTITTTANITGAGTIQGAGTYDYGDTATLTVTTNYGYTFTRWGDGNTDNPRIVVVTSDSAFTAVFTPNPYTIITTTAPTDITFGETRGNIVYNYGDTVWLGAYAKMHCRFVEWSDGNTDNPRMLVVASDTTFTAHFAPRDTLYEHYAPEVIRDTVIVVDTVYVNTKGVSTTPNVATIEATTADDHDEDAESSNRKDGNFGGLFANNERAYIPDGPDCTELGLCRTSEITVSGFSEGRLIQSPEDIVSICVNMEDSFLGELKISVICPSGDIAVLKYKDTVGIGIQVPDGTWGGGGKYLGIPYGGNNHHDYDTNACDPHYNPYGLGYEYCFSRNSTRTLVNDQPANTPFPDNAGFANAPRDSVTYAFPPIPAGFNGAGSSCGEVTVMTLPASNREDGSGFYVPASDFTSLVGCPFNGVWSIEICDAWNLDNGWLFGWSIDFGSGVYVSSQDTALGNVEGYGFSASVTQTRVAAMPKAGNYFMGWSDGSEDNPYSLTVFGDTTLVAYFAERDSLVIYDTVDTLYIHDTIFIHDTIYVGIADVSVLNAKVYSSNGKIVVEGADGNKVTLYDVNGRMLATKQDKFTPLRFDAPVNGTYLIKIGNYPARKVVVIR